MEEKVYLSLEKSSYREGFFYIIDSKGNIVGSISTNTNVLFLYVEGDNDFPIKDFTVIIR